MIDFAVIQKSDSNNHWQDQKIENRDIAMVSAEDELKQNLMIRLKFVFGEWFLDTTKGVMYFEKIFVKKPDIPAIDREFKRIILKTDGVINLVEFYSNYNLSKREYSLKFKVNTIYGELVFDETLLKGV